jgi:hypothetical protein
MVTVASMDVNVGRRRQGAARIDVAHTGGGAIACVDPLAALFDLEDLDNLEAGGRAPDRTVGGEGGVA